MTAEEPPALRGPQPLPALAKLWRLSRPERKAALAPYIGRRVRVERWYTRVAAQGDRTYLGELIAVATSTIGSAADLAIIHSTDGNVWAISTAQIAYLEEPTPPRRSR